MMMMMAVLLFLLLLLFLSSRTLTSAQKRSTFEITHALDLSSCLSQRINIERQNVTCFCLRPS